MKKFYALLLIIALLFSFSACKSTEDSELGDNGSPTSSAIGALSSPTPSGTPFSDVNNFIRSFKKQFGIPPGQYCRQLLEENE